MNPCATLDVPPVDGGAIYITGGYGGAYPCVAFNDIRGTVVCSGDGGGIYCTSSDATIVSNVFELCTAYDDSSSDGGGIACHGSAAPCIANNIFSQCEAARCGGGVAVLDTSAPDIINNTFYYCDSIDAQKGGAIYLNTSGTADIYNNIITGTSYGCGLYEDGNADPNLDYNCWYENHTNLSTDCHYQGVNGGAHRVEDQDPKLVNPASDDFHLESDSPCIEAGYNDAPCLPDEDFEGDRRIVDADEDDDYDVDIGADEYDGAFASACYTTAAPDPQPYGSGALFGQPSGGFPGWVWFSIPLDPDDCCGSDCYDPETILGYDCGGALWKWDKYGKYSQVYNPPFADWNLAVGNSYLLYLTAAITNPSYEGREPAHPFEFQMGTVGWTWVGKPGSQLLTGGGQSSDFMTDEVKVEYDGDERTAWEDHTDNNPWISWGWSFRDTYTQAAKTFTPYATFGNMDCHPWIGYRAYVNVYDAGPPAEEVILIWPVPDPVPSDPCD